eukprot:scaffold16752_cov85-Phaeocystis_antarctica.AAC.3
MLRHLRAPSAFKVVKAALVLLAHAEPQQPGSCAESHRVHRHHAFQPAATHRLLQHQDVSRRRLEGIYACCGAARGGGKGVVADVGADVEQ